MSLGTTEWWSIIRVGSSSEKFNNAPPNALRRLGPATNFSVLRLDSFEASGLMASPSFSLQIHFQ
jgi:hypothetical protein